MTVLVMSQLESFQGQKKPLLVNDKRTGSEMCKCRLYQVG